MSTIDKRIANLDLLRATAILMVVAYHVVQWLPIKPKWLIYLANPGQYGVNLFFALSGFLVGSLYFRERHGHRFVDKTRFILRRITRTVPVYLIALAVSFLGSMVFEGEQFEWRYLVFLQNYMKEIPFFKVSWSLCVEEHFYALLPFALSLFYILHKCFGSAPLKIILFALLLLPTYFRIVEFQPGQPFGAATTASQFYMDSLGFGVLAAWLFLHWKVLSAQANLFVILCLLALVAVLFGTNLASAAQNFGPGLLVMGILFAALTLFSASSHQLDLAGHPIVKIVAVSSYSIYITHAIVLQVLNMVIRRLPEALQELWPLVLLLFAGISLFAGILFYQVIERPLLALREKIYPAQRASSPPHLCG
jgi:peptidoglycan/LPS O-acetylase OafA/YrhL